MRRGSRPVLDREGVMTYAAPGGVARRAAFRVLCYGDGHATVEVAGVVHLIAPGMTVWTYMHEIFPKEAGGGGRLASGDETRQHRGAGTTPVYRGRQSPRHR